MTNRLLLLFVAVIGLTGNLSISDQTYNLQLRSKLAFPGQKLANICGYAQNGREYALVGANRGLIIVDVTDPDNPVQIVQIPGPVNDWKEIKTYGHYAYVTSEGGQGVQIVDMSALPSPDLPYKHYMGDGSILGQLTSIHALHIDTNAGFLYAWGSKLFSGGAVILDLADPYNPVYAGKYDALGYIHDGYVDNDTMYAGHIYTGTLSIVDMQDKANPKLLGTVQTPGRFTHNAWLLDDHKHILTTDEAFPSFVTSYDISDPTNITELDRLSTNDGTQSIGHNTHVKDNWAITSWYTDGFTIIDAHRPDNLVEVGRYDTYANPGKFDGCWGVYPFLPSGNIIASNINPGEMFIATPTYVRACYLEGRVTVATNGQPIAGVQLKMTAIGKNELSKTDGSFKTGYHQAGTYTIEASKLGYLPKTVQVELKTGEVTTVEIVLEKGIDFTVNGTVTETNTGNIIPNARVHFVGLLDSLVFTDEKGAFSTELPQGTYEVTAFAWGYTTKTVTVSGGGAVNVTLDKDIYFDDFSNDYGWLSFGDAATGFWELGDPIGTSTQGQAANPENDMDTDNNTFCYVTGNRGGGAGDDDVDGGSVTLTCPLMQLAGYQDATLSFNYWFFNGGGSGNPNDTFMVKVTNGVDEALVLLQRQSASQWRASGNISLASLIQLTDEVQVQFITADQVPGHVVEAGVDLFKVVPVKSVGVKPLNDPNAGLQVMPNPSATDFMIRYDWPNALDITLEVRNALGQLVANQSLAGSNGAVAIGESWAKGIYFAVLKTASRQSSPVRMVKQ